MREAERRQEGLSQRLQAHRSCPRAGGWARAASRRTAALELVSQPTSSGSRSSELRPRDGVMKRTLNPTAPAGAVRVRGPAAAAVRAGAGGGARAPFRALVDAHESKQTRRDDRAALLCGMGGPVEQVLASPDGTRWGTRPGGWTAWRSGGCVVGSALTTVSAGPLASSGFGSAPT